MSAIAVEHARPAAFAATGRRRDRTAAGLFAVVFVVDLALGLWLAAKGFRHNDAISRTNSAWFAIHGADPHLASVGFVWMPLPTLVQLAWMPLVPLVPTAVSSGLVSTLTTAITGAAAAALLVTTAGRLGLPRRLGVLYALVVSLHPMLLLYAGNGMSDSFAALFLIGTVCGIVLFWHTGARTYVALAGLSLALGFASVYEAVPFGAVAFLALVAGVLFPRETGTARPHGRRSAIGALGTTFLLPACTVGALWLIANWTIQGRPLYFLDGPYSNTAQNDASIGLGGGAGTAAVSGDALAALGYLAVRTAPFLLPLLAILAIRTLEGRFLRVNTLVVTGLSVSVSVGVMGPLLYAGATAGFLRYFMYPLFVAAGWGLYEIARSRRRRLAASLLVAGWVAAIPTALAAMADERLGQEEFRVVEAVRTGADAQEVGFADLVGGLAPLADRLRSGPLRAGEQVLVDAFRGGSIVTQLPPRHSDQIISTPDRRFERVLAAPAAAGVRYVLMPDPELWPQDAVGRRYPRLWTDEQPGFREVMSFSARIGSSIEDWRMFEVLPPDRPPSPLPYRVVIRDGKRYHSYPAAPGRPARSLYVHSAVR